jgi:pimeloyl-ACP methyl ester carboxylesterase
MTPLRSPRQPILHTIHRAPPTPSPAKSPPLLFLHGGYVDARSWDAHFLPFFASHGYDCHALDFSGHGGSDGREYLDALSLDDYLADAQQVIAGFDQRPIVIGHSMGSFIAERLLEQSLAVAAVLLAPVPTQRHAGVGDETVAEVPEVSWRSGQCDQGAGQRDRPAHDQGSLFFADDRPETLLRFAQLVQPESARAICDLALLGCWRWSPKPPPAQPVLVVGWRTRHGFSAAADPPARPALERRTTDRGRYRTRLDSRRALERLCRGRARLARTARTTPGRQF